MAKLLFRLGRWSFLHKWRVIVAWLLILGATAGGALSLMRPFTSEFAISGTPAISALDTLEENFPGQGNVATAPGVNLVFAAPEGRTLDEPEYMEAMDDTVGYIRDNLEGLTGTERFGNPVAVNTELKDTIVGQMTEMGLPEETAKADAYNLRMVSDDGRIGYTTFEFGAESSMSVEQADRDVVNEAMELGREAGLEVEAGGAGFGDPIEINTTSELIGIGVAFLVLLVTFGSFAASTMPIVTAIVGVGIGALTVVGQCLGAGEKVQAKRYSRLLLLTAYAGDWVMNLSGLFFLNKLALSWFNLSPEAYGMALELMVWFNVVSLILWPSSFTLPNILRAAGDAAFTMTVSVISMWVFRVAFCYLMVLKFHCGLLFIWLGMFLDWAMRSLFFCVRFVRGRWMEQKVI